MARLEFDIPDYTRGLTLGLALGPGGGLPRRISLALAGAHVRALEAEARRRAPVRTGRLRNSMRAHLAGAGRGVLEATAPYAKHLHGGTGIYGPSGTPIVIEPRGRRALHWPGAAHPVRRVRQRGIRPRDFLRQAVRMYFPALQAFAMGLRTEVLAIFARNYMKLRAAKDYYQAQKEKQPDLKPGTVDKYFHCKANCEAAKLGCLAESVLLSDVKEWYGLKIDNLRRDEQHKHTPEGSRQEQLANRFGRARGSMEPSVSCGDSCAHYRPDWLPERFW
jgi:hypothetical protein